MGGPAVYTFGGSPSEGENPMLTDDEIPAELRTWAAEIEKDPSRYPTRKVDAELLRRAAELIERLSRRRRS